jgi:hypothetical protein
VGAPNPVAKWSGSQPSLCFSRAPALCASNSAEMTSAGAAYRAAKCSERQPSLFFLSRPRSVRLQQRQGDLGGRPVPSRAVQRKPAISIFLSRHRSVRLQQHQGDRKGRPEPSRVVQRKRIIRCFLSRILLGEARAPVDVPELVPQSSFSSLPSEDTSTITCMRDIVFGTPRGKREGGDAGLYLFAGEAVRGGGRSVQKCDGWCRLLFAKKKKQQSVAKIH